MNNSTMIRTSLSLFMFSVSTTVIALSNDAKVPVLLYHSHQVGVPCDDYSTNAVLALERDLEMMKRNNYTVVPVYWIAEWARGLRDGSTLPDKVVGITFDDGLNADWIDNADPGHACAPVRSFRSVLQEFKARHPDLPWYSPHAASFVIAAPTARDAIEPGNMSDDWWAEANNSGIMEIYNHSAEHDHPDIAYQTWDPYLGIWLAVGGYGDGIWNGIGRFPRIDTYLESHYEVVKSAQFIASKTGAWPDLFAYPWGAPSDYLRYTYFPNYGEHQTLAAFCTGDAHISRASDPYCLPRYSYGSPSGWTGEYGEHSLLTKVLQKFP